jgi:hypothetical protein
MWKGGHGDNTQRQMPVLCELAYFPSLMRQLCIFIDHIQILVDDEEE